MDIKLLQDTFLYFAKFPSIDGVNRNFNVTTSRSFGTEYSDFRTEIENMTEQELIPGIQDYVFGVDEDMIKRRLNDIKGTYLFVDYGKVDIDQETNALVEMNNFLLSVTVAYPVKENELDAVEMMLMHQQTLNYISQIKNKMVADKKKSALVKDITFPVEIMPWRVRELMGSIGWSMQFSKQGVGLI